MLVDTVEGDIVADAVLAFMEDFRGMQWTGTATELLSNLKFRVDLKTTLDSKWPKNGRALSARLRRLRKGLLASGIEVKLGDHNNRDIQLWWVGKSRVAPLRLDESFFTAR
jgi:hypothetical protein